MFIFVLCIFVHAGIVCIVWTCCARAVRRLCGSVPRPPGALCAGGALCCSVRACEGVCCIGCIGRIAVCSLLSCPLCCSASVGRAPCLRCVCTVVAPCLPCYQGCPLCFCALGPVLHRTSPPQPLPEGFPVPSSAETSIDTLLTHY